MFCHRQTQIAVKVKFHRIKSRVKTSATSNTKRQCKGFQCLNFQQMNFIQLYDYLIVSTCKYRHIVLKGTHKKFKSYQFFFKGNIKKSETELFENKTYERVNILPSMKRTPYRVVVGFLSTCDAWQWEMQPRRRSALCYRRFY